MEAGGTPNNLELTRHDQVLLEEYRQVAEDLRVAWQYIFAFVKNFALIQIVIVSIVGLGGGAIRYGAVGFYQSATEYTVGAEDHNMRKQKEDQSVIQKRKENRFRWFTMLLATIAFVFSVGGVVHNWRLFDIAEAFVDRAQVLEKELWNGEDASLVGPQDAKVEGHYAYMHKRIKDNERNPLRVERLLSYVFIASAVIWALYLLSVWSLNLPFFD